MDPSRKWSCAVTHHDFLSAFFVVSERLSALGYSNEHALSFFSLIISHPLFEPPVYGGGCEERLDHFHGFVNGAGEVIRFESDEVVGITLDNLRARIRKLITESSVDGFDIDSYLESPAWADVGVSDQSESDRGMAIDDEGGIYFALDDGIGEWFAVTLDASERVARDADGAPDADVFLEQALG